ncbi:hypothetical protein HELRODRAFT_175003 [Helobdella robusta]|uniref:Acetylserotonin O-methyltransferase n=1 Tax=Helobdella robusta TaxID=6412 RepID=T1F8Q1_HELRO|nr:hypothetical protein HELRODRAFT_175003 [Helobdella robusta]ESO01444.1 hypothetical protein HELRODRAFT_175003 [Helobdella robusta]
MVTCRQMNFEGMLIVLVVAFVFKVSGSVAYARKQVQMPTDLSMQQVRDMLVGFQKTQLIYSASSLGIFEELGIATEPTAAMTLATKLSLNADATERLLNALTAIRLVIKSVDSNNVAVYTIGNSAKQYLLITSRFSLKPLVTKIGDLYNIYGKLSQGVKEGKKQLTAGTFDGGFYTSDEKTKQFLATMHMFSNSDGPHVLNALDLSQFKTAHDIGGGPGSFGYLLAKKYPKMNVTVSDLPSVIKFTSHFLPADLPANLYFESVDFFIDTLRPADLYIMDNVLHDWNEESLNKLITRVHQAINPGGSLMVMEKFLNQEKDGPLTTLIMDLGMLLTSDGRERTLAEYQQFFTKYGFETTHSASIPDSKFKDVMLLKKLP